VSVERREHFFPTSKSGEQHVERLSSSGEVKKNCRGQRHSQREPYLQDVVEHLKKSRGRISLLLQQFREVGSDGRALGAFLGGVESQFGKVVTNELLSLAPKVR